MLSVIVYGRNDSHGYNLHKRAAISLNAIAEVLTAPDDEILFVDYNTPDDFPTFVEAIHDTLTSRAKDVLRVLRVRPAHHQRYLGRTQSADHRAGRPQHRAAPLESRKTAGCWRPTATWCSCRGGPACRSPPSPPTCRTASSNCRASSCRRRCGNRSIAASPADIIARCAPMGGAAASQRRGAGRRHDPVRRAGRFPIDAACRSVRHRRLRRGDDPWLAHRFQHRQTVHFAAREGSRRRCRTCSATTATTPASLT